MEACQDTHARAADARSKQGTHELEISFGGELDLHKHFQSCTKNPGHTDFIPIHKLRQDHLPNALRSPENLNFIEQLAHLTVKLSVRYVSPHRKPPLPLSDYAGQHVLSVGSGFVSNTCLLEMPCPFDNCPEFQGQHQVYGYIVITTAAHVVLDDVEAKNTTVEFAYDNCQDRSNVLTAKGVKIGSVSVEGDFCELLCVTHDRKLFSWLEYQHICKYESRYIPSLRKKYNDIHNLFHMFPCLEHIQTKYDMHSSQDFLVHINPYNVTDVAKLLAVLLTNDILELVIDIHKLASCSYKSKSNHNINVKRFDSENITIECMHGKKTYNYNDMTRDEILKCEFDDNDDILMNHLENHLEKPLKEDPINVDGLNSFINLSFLLPLAIAILKHEEKMYLFISARMRPNTTNVSYNISSHTEEVHLEMFHISHPHGQSKHITFGTQIDCLTGDGHYMPLYTVPTCPGCSGGPVWVIPETKKLEESYGVLHGGSYDKQLNHGCSWTIYPPGRQDLTC